MSAFLGGHGKKRRWLLGNVLASTFGASDFSFVVFGKGELSRELFMAVFTEEFVLWHINLHRIRWMLAPMVLQLVSDCKLLDRVDMRELKIAGDY
jgi:hypothetical protein